MTYETIPYVRCTHCGLIDKWACGIFFGHTCDRCGAVDAATLHRRKRVPKSPPWPDDD